MHRMRRRRILLVVVVLSDDMEKKKKKQQQVMFEMDNGLYRSRTYSMVVLDAMPLTRAEWVGTHVVFRSKTQMMQKMNGSHDVDRGRVVDCCPREIHRDVPPRVHPLDDGSPEKPGLSILRTMSSPLHSAGPIEHAVSYMKSPPASPPPSGAIVGAVVEPQRTIPRRHSIDRKDRYTQSSPVVELGVVSHHTRRTRVW